MPEGEVSSIYADLKIRGLAAAQRDLRVFRDEIQDAGKELLSLDRIRLEGSGFGRATVGARSLGRELDEVSASAERARRDIESSANAGGGFDVLQSRLFFVRDNLEALAEVGRATFDAMKAGATSLDLERSLGVQIRNSGGNLDQFLATLDKAAAGTVSDYALMQAASKSFAFGVSQDADQLADLLEVVRFRSKEAGIGVQEGLTRTIEGIGKGEVELLDELFAIRPSQVYAEYARSVGVAATSLDDATKKQLLLNEIIRSGQADIQAAGGLTDGLSERLNRFERDAGNARTEWEQFIAVVGTRGLEALGGREILQGAGQMAVDLQTTSAAVQGVSAALAQMDANGVVLTRQEGQYIRLAAEARRFDEVLSLLQQRDPSSVQAFTEAFLRQADAFNMTRDEALHLLYGLEMVNAEAYSSSGSIGGASKHMEILGKASLGAADGMGVASGQARALSIDLLSVEAQAGAAASALSRIGSASAILDPQIGFRNAQRQLADLRASGPKLDYFGVAASPASVMQHQAALLEAQVNVQRAGERAASEIERDYNAAYASATRAAGGLARSAGGVGRAHRSAADEAARAYEKSAQEAERAYQSAFSNLQGIVGRNIRLDSSVGENDELLDRFGLRVETTAEPLRRLQDVVNRGAESEWANYYAAQLGLTPGMGDELKARAARLMQDVQAGLRPDLLSREALITNSIRDIEGQRALDALRDDVTKELAGRGYLQEEISASLGVDVKASFSALGQENGPALVDSLVSGLRASMTAQQEAITAEGKRLGKYFADGVRNSEAFKGLAEDIVAMALDALAEAAEY